MVNTRKHMGCRDLSLSVHKLCHGDLDDVTLLVELFRYCPLGNHTCCWERPSSARAALKGCRQSAALGSSVDPHASTRYVSQLTPSGKYALTPLDVSCSSARFRRVRCEQRQRAEEDAERMSSQR